MSDTIMAKQKKIEKVHFVLGHHPPGQKIVPSFDLRPEVKTVVFEGADGHHGKREISETDIAGWKKGTTFTDSRNDLARRALRAGKRVVIGEFLSSDFAKKVNATIVVTIRKAQEDFNRNPTLTNFKKKLRIDIIREIFRHEMIRLTITDSLQHGDVELYYGTGHALNAARLREEGTPVSTQFTPQLQSYYSRLMRMLVKKSEIGIRNPQGQIEIIPKGALNKISDIQAARALVSSDLFGKKSSVGKLFGVPASKVTEEHIILATLMEKCILDKMSDQQVMEYMNEGNHRVFFEAHGLPNPITEKPIGMVGIRAFLEQHSSFYRKHMK
jgi:hypothetical protein